jgi:hypothetical protein
MATVTPSEMAYVFLISFSAGLGLTMGFHTWRLVVGLVDSFFSWLDSRQPREPLE